MFKESVGQGGVEQNGGWGTGIGLSIRPGTHRSSGGYSVVNHPLPCLDYQLNAYYNGLKLIPTLACSSDTYFKSY